jgi:4-hydroxy-4-methyl-2-oxoglutarate aldolase
MIAYSLKGIYWNSIKRFDRGGIMMNLSREVNKELLELYRDLRVADVRDGMDWNMMHHYGSISYEIRPLYRTRAAGIARTVRYLPYEQTIPTMTPEEYSEWSGWYYGNVCTYPWIEEIEAGDFVVIDQSGVDAGLMGSNNSLAGFKNGARGYISNGGVRDTDELILQRIPFWSKFVSQKMVQGRLRYDSRNIPVNAGGVIVHPGDVVVADGDGVIVVPRKIAFDVATYAHKELSSDKAARKQLYVELGRELDDTVK